MPISTDISQNKTAKSSEKTNSRVEKVIELNFDKDKADLTQDKTAKPKEDTKNRVIELKFEEHRESITKVIEVIPTNKQEPLLNSKEVQQDQGSARVARSMHELGTENMAAISNTIKSKTNAKTGSRIRVRKRFVSDEEPSTFTGICNLSMLTH